MSSGPFPPPRKRERLKERAGTTVSLALILAFALLVLIPIISGNNDHATPPPTGVGSPPGLVSDDPTVPPELKQQIEQIARREAAQRYCNAHPEAAATEQCTDGV